MFGPIPYDFLTQLVAELLLDKTDHFRVVPSRLQNPSFIRCLLDFVRMLH